MEAEDDTLVWKFANSFSPDAEMSERARSWFVFGGRSSVDWLRRMQGGLWVGGSVLLTRDSLDFSPNGMNAAAHAGDTSWSVPLARIVSAKRRFGWVSGIIDVRSDDSRTFTFRCFGARSFVRTIADRVRQRTGRVLR